VVHEEPHLDQEKSTMHRIATLFASTLLITGTASAAVLTVTIENLQTPGGFSFTPVWFGFHDGSFSSFGPGQSASLFPGAEQIAELGNTSALSSRFSSEQAFGVQTTVTDLNGAPVFSPGESRSFGIDVDPTLNAWVSFMSMLVPTNDLFIGNPNAIKLFESGAFTGPVTLDIYGAMVWDAGTEVNDLLDGGAFVAGVDATGGTDENGVAHLLFAGAGAQAYLDGIVGTITADGGLITQSFGSATLLGRITIVPAPGTAFVMTASLLLGRGRRRADRTDRAA
jgi:Spondin_N